ncbi:MAG: efflux RND transporter periplasmic adaptor subunit [bacterium]|nr:efflux RND transporter periplasmic adaptor subunit [bacterium]
MFTFVKRHKITAILSIVLVIIVAVFVFSFGEGDTLPEFAVVERGDVVQEVALTGRIKPAESAELAFEQTGRIAKIYVDIGDKVSSGQALISLENSEASSKLAQAEAQVSSAKAVLSQYQAALVAKRAELLDLRKGARQEEIEVQEAKVQSAKLSVEDAEKNVVDVLMDAYTKADDAVRNKADQIFDNPRSSNPKIISSVSASLQLELQTENERRFLENFLVSWSEELSGADNQNDLVFLISSTIERVTAVKSFLDKVSSVLNDAGANSDLSQTVLDGWKSDVFSARNSMSTVTSNITAADEKLRSHQATLVVAEKELILKKAEATEEKIATSEAAVAQAEATVFSQQAKIMEAEANSDFYRSQLQKTIVRSPIDGVVTDKKVKLGEIVSAGASAVSVISEEGLEIEAQMPEVDVAKVAVGNVALVTLDAYGRDEIFKASVFSIDPAETVIDGVSTYRTSFSFLEEDDRVRSGMTAKITILTEKRENVISVPQRAVIRKNGNIFVRIYENGNTREIPVVTGIRGSFGNIEIESGLKEGDRIVVNPE